MKIRIFDNTLFKNAGIYTIANVLNSAIPFLLLPLLTRYLTPTEYGYISMYSLLITFTVPFVGFNVNGAIARQFYNKERYNIWEYVWNSIIILCFSASLVSIIFYSFSESISKVASFPSEMLWTVIVYTISQFIVEIISVIWQVKNKALVYSIFNSAKILVNFFLSILFVVFLGYGWKGGVYGQLISLTIFATIAISILVKNRWIKTKINKAHIINALNFGVPLIPHSLSGSIISMTDRLFITNMVGLSTTGIYTAGYQIGSIINILAASFNKAYMPWLYEKLSINSKQTKSKIVKFTYLYFLIILFLAILIGMISPFILRIFLGVEYINSSKYVLWIALGYAFNGMYLMVVNFIFYEQQTKSLSMVTFLTAALNIVLNYILIDQYGAIGAAQATTITFFLKFIFVWGLAAKAHQMPWIFWRKTT